MKSVLFYVFAILCIAIGFYPLMYLFGNTEMGLLSTKTTAFLSNNLWQAGFYTHIMFGGVALLTGWSQFIKKWRTQRPKLHRTLGKIYLIAVIFSSLAAIYIAFYATGGIIPSLGFLGLGIVWLLTSLMAWRHIRNGRIIRHQIMMTFSYAACFAAVTLRLWLPLLSSLTGDFVTAYKIVAWLCWVPNMAIAYFLVKKYLPEVRAVR